MNDRVREKSELAVVYHLEFTLGEKRFALPLENVERVVHAAEITVPPESPDLVEGFVNYKGRILPVVDISPRFHMPRIPLDPSFHFIIVTVKQKKYALIGHTVAGVMKTPGNTIVPPNDIVYGVEYLAGVISMENGMMLIPDLGKTLAFAPGEIKALKDAVKKKHAKGKRT